MSALSYSSAEGATPGPRKDTFLPIGASRGALVAQLDAFDSVIGEHSEMFRRDRALELWQVAARDHN